MRRRPPVRSSLGSPLLQAVLLAAAGAAALCAAPAQYFGRQNDDALYVITSHALASGTYRNILSPGLPPLTMIMPGFPLLLLPVTLLAGGSFPAYQLFCALLTAGLPCLLWWWLRKRLDPGPALLVPLVFALHPIVLAQAGTVMSESAYTALAVLFLAAAESRKPAAVGGLLLALSQVRPAGFSLLPAALAGALRRRDWRAAGLCALPALLAAAAWYGWCYAVSGEIGEFHELRFSYAGQPRLHALAVAFDNARFYAGEWGAAILPRSWSSWGWLPGGLLAGLTLAGAWRLRRREDARPALWMLAGAAALHAVWTWQYDRYLIPLLPWLLWLAAEGAGRRAVWLLGALLALQVSFHSRHWVLSRTSLERPELARTYEWLRRHSAPHEAVASPLYARDGLLCGRPSLPLPDVADPASLAAALGRRRTRWVLWQDRLDIGVSLAQTSNLQRKLRGVLPSLEDRRFFRLIHQDDREGSRVYELLPDRTPGS